MTLRLFAHNLFVTTNTYSVDPYNEELQTFMQLHARLTEFLLTVVCFSCPFMVQHDQFNENSWSRRFLTSRELTTAFIFASLFLSVPFSLFLVVVYLDHVRCIGFTRIFPCCFCFFFFKFYFFHTHSLCSCSFCLLFPGEMI